MAADKEIFRQLEKVYDPSGVITEATQHLYLGVDPSSSDNDAAEVAKQLADASGASAPVSGLELYDTQLRRPGSNTVEIIRQWKQNSVDNERINAESYAEYQTADNFGKTQVTAITCTSTETNESLATDNWFGVRARASITLSGTSISAVPISYGGKNYSTTPGAIVVPVDDGAGHTAILTATVGTAQATGTVNLVGTAVASVTMTAPGMSYASTVNPTFAGDGTGAVGQSIIDQNGKITGVRILNPGSGYTTCTVSWPVVNGVITSFAISGSNTGFTAVPRITIPYQTNPLFTDTRIAWMRMRKVNKTKAYMTVRYEGISSPAKVTTLLFEGYVYMKRDLDSGTWKAYVWVAAAYTQATTGGTKYVLYLTPQLVHWPYRRITLRQNLYTDRVFTSTWTPNTVIGGEFGGDFSQFIGSSNSAVTAFTKHPAGYLKYVGARCPETNIQWEGTIIRSAMMEYEFEENPRHFVNPVGWRSIIEGVDTLPTGSVSGAVGWVDITTITVGGVQVMGSDMPALTSAGPWALL